MEKFLRVYTNAPMCELINDNNWIIFVFENGFGHPMLVCWTTYFRMCQPFALVASRLIMSWLTISWIGSWILQTVSSCVMRWVIFESLCFTQKLIQQSLIPIWWEIKCYYNETQTPNYLMKFDEWSKRSKFSMKRDNCIDILIFQTSKENNPINL